MLAEGNALLSVSRTNSILRETSDETLTLETEGNGVRVTGSSGRSKFKLPGANPDEFPRVVGFDEEKYHEVPAELFRQLVQRTVFATDAESGRFALGGVLLEMEESSVIAIGTDGRRLAKMTGTGTSIGEHKTSGNSTIVPTRAIQLMQRAVDKDDVVQLAARENDLMVRTSRCMIYSRLVEGRYPNWRQVFPSREGAVQIDLTVGPLYAALRQAAIVADQESRGIDFTFSEGTLRMEANTAEIGESSVDLPINYSGESVTLTMDHRYVSDFCKVLDAEGAMVMEIDGAAAPVLLSTEDGYSYVIMPMSRK
ncbi:MAG: DNA polymerase III subunit beta [Planctomycetota bacterium]